MLVTFWSINSYFNQGPNNIKDHLIALSSVGNMITAKHSLEIILQAIFIPRKETLRSRWIVRKWEVQRERDREREIEREKEINKIGLRLSTIYDKYFFTVRFYTNLGLLFIILLLSIQILKNCLELILLTKQVFFSPLLLGMYSSKRCKTNNVWRNLIKIIFDKWHYIPLQAVLNCFADLFNYNLFWICTKWHKVSLRSGFITKSSTTSIINKSLPRHKTQTQPQGLWTAVSWLQWDPQGLLQTPLKHSF